MHLCCEKCTNIPINLYWLTDRNKMDGWMSYWTKCISSRKTFILYPIIRFCFFYLVDSKVTVVHHYHIIMREVHYFWTISICTLFIFCLFLLKQSSENRVTQSQTWPKMCFVILIHQRKAKGFESQYCSVNTSAAKLHFSVRGASFPVAGHKLYQRGRSFLFNLITIMNLCLYKSKSSHSGWTVSQHRPE